MNRDSDPNINLIELVEDTFTKVNNKIDGLLDCSVKDFVLLNSVFKEYHSLLNSLSKSTNSFFKFILTSQYDEDITLQCKEAENYAQKLKKEIKAQLTDFKELKTKYSFILLSTNNLKQDISTLRLLFTNLRFDPSLEIDQNRIHDCINYLSECYLDCENRVKGLFKKLNKITIFSDEGYRNGLELYSDIIEKVNNQITLLSSIRKASLKYEKQITEIEERKTSSASEIITNLQFQDILRQKIEHIQSAHIQITNSLYSKHNSGNNLSQQELFQIRDISSLQSALLVHANQEYQTAVENILRRISEMRQLVNIYNTIWTHFCIPEKIKMQNIISKVNEDLSLLHSQSFSLNQVSEKYIYLLTEISELQIETSNQIASNKCLSDGISNLEDLIKNAKIDESDSQQFSPIQQLKKELSKFRDGYSKLTLRLSEFKDNAFSDYINSFQNNELNTQKLNVNSNKIANLIKDLSKKIAKDVSSAEISETIAEFGVDQVEYYKSFEKEVREMIALLDNLLTKVNLRKTDIDKNELDHLKELYTMQSERDVHEKLTKEKEDSSDNGDKDTNDDEVEFF